MQSLKEKISFDLNHKLKKEILKLVLWALVMLVTIS